MQSKLQVLQEKYDILLKAKLATEEKYKLDYKRWKNLKAFLLEKEKRKFGETRRKLAVQAATAANTSMPIIARHSTSPPSSPTKQSMLIRHRSLGMCSTERGPFVAYCLLGSLEDDIVVRNASMNPMRRIFGTNTTAARDEGQNPQTLSSQPTKQDLLSVCTHGSYRDECAE